MGLCQPAVLWVMERVFPLEKSGHGVTLTIRLHLMSELRMGGAISTRPLSLQGVHRDNLTLFDFIAVRRYVISAADSGQCRREVEVSRHKLLGGPGDPEGGPGPG